METADASLYRLLVDCLVKKGPQNTGTRLSRLSKEQWRHLLSLAKTQRVVALLWSRLTTKGLDAAVPDEPSGVLKESYRQNTMRNLRYYRELRLLLSSLKPEGIPLILLKGIFLAEAVYGKIGVREMNDIDVLAHSDDLAKIADILTGRGYVPVQSICVETTLHLEPHLPLLIKEGHAHFEIHWNVTTPNESLSISPDELWERAVPVRIAGCDALALSPEDMLLHLCWHTSYQHQFAFGLRPFCDIAETIDHFGADLDWRVVTERADLWGWQRGLYLSLLLARELVGADVPETVLAHIKPKDMTESIFEIVWAQVLTDSKFAFSIPVPFAELLESKRLWDKIRIFWQRIFLPKAVMSLKYSVPKNSAIIYLCYLRRVKEVLHRHYRTLKKYGRNDASLISLASRKRMIADWLVNPSGPTGTLICRPADISPVSSCPDFWPDTERRPPLE